MTVQVECCCLANARWLDFIATVNHGLQASLNDFKQHETVIVLTFVPFWCTAACIFLEGFWGLVYQCFIKWSSLAVVSLGCPLLSLSLNGLKFLKFSIAVCTVLLQLSSSSNKLIFWNFYCKMSLPLVISTLHHIGKISIT